MVQGRVRTWTAAAKKVGLSREHLARQIGLAHVAQHLRDRAARAVAVGAGRAAAKMVELLEAPSSAVQHDSAKFLLGVAGVKPASDAQVSVNIDLKAGFVIDLSGRSPSERPMKVVSPQPGAVAVGDKS